MIAEHDNQASPQDEETGKIPEVLPILPVIDLTLFPRMVLPLVVQEDASQQLVDEAMAKNRLIGLLVSKKKDLQTPHKPEDLYTVGTGALILKLSKPDPRGTQLLVQGIGRFRILNYLQTDPYLRAEIEPIAEQSVKDIEVEAMMSNLVSLFIKVLELAPYLPRELGALAKSLDEGGMLADLIASGLNLSKEEKQKILETQDVKERLKEVTKLINRELQVLELGKKIQSQVKEDLDKSQREFYLRQQLKAIKEELGEKDEDKVGVEEYRAKIAEKNLPEEARKEAERELERLARMHPSSSEYTVASTYLDWLTSIPWNESTEDILDIKKAQKVLDEDHYNLDKVKKRIIEYLAVRKLKPDSKGPILCFVGPPGTGKTSLGRSIARALGRKFVRLSLGGVRDEAEIRGHRRTYVGALPGRIIQGIRRAESNNPVFMLDEIDKVGTDFRGDPSSALLEVLDPEQNFSFSDHYLDVPFDLSRVMFITTANILDTIPPALRDRMEVLDLPGYTQEEKVKIAQSFLIPRQLEAHGLTRQQLTITTGVIKRIISGYTREAGLRNLERELATICRGVARAVAEGRQTPTHVKAKDIQKYLGPVRFRSEMSERISTPGVAAGLAWTQTGGDLIFVEATMMKGKQSLTLTGQLGDVMKESATAALSYIRSHAKALGIPEDFFQNHDIHIHVPAGAIPKDGPSAGVTMLTALASLLTGRTVVNGLAMTGEITLRGQVLPVGGIKEKVLAAHRSGIKTVILPKWNQKDLEDVPPKVRKAIRFHFVESMDKVLEVALSKH
ncbi:MAG: endopeptidase La [Deltaproteobacteria bacterium]|nr:endopeptidase La [Deltaproteobacteria bacterium]MBW2073422.1 endopeptidase La [Deltaproteobacteria bacterium]RLB83978.1 MAG: endopeptidase La [Deltaproteobacteria bacterium]